MRDHISKYLKINEIITPSQHGFVPNRACMTNLLETLYVITNVVNKGKSVDLVLLNLNHGHGHTESIYRIHIPNPNIMTMVIPKVIANGGGRSDM